MNTQTVLVVEDDEAIRDMIVFNLERAGFLVIEAGDCQNARVKIADELPDLLLLDWMLPDASGVELARSLRRDEMTREMPIIMLTARAMEDDKVRGLDSGADDYVTKPFGARELIARINALLRRSTPGGADDTIEFGGLVLNIASHRVTGNGRSIELGPTEFRMLRFFMGHPDRVYSRTQLLDYVWGGGVFIEERTVDVHVLRLRKALAPQGFDRYIQTVRGAGYRFSAVHAAD